MKTKIALILISGIYFLLISINSKAQEKGALIIEAQSFENDEGKAVVHLFREKDDMPKEPFLTSEGKIMEGKVQFDIKDLAYGEYAAIIFHDENANDILDHKFGFPNEPMGFSNNWKLSLFSGMPNFKKLKFTFSENNEVYKIKMD